MAYTTLRVGSRGDDVVKLQKELIAQGYNVGSAGADGIYGNNTAAAVKQYQTDKQLTVDGIAGNQTLGSLYSASATNQQTAAQTDPSQAPSDIKGVNQGLYDQMTETYTPSENVNNAWAAIEELQTQLKGESKYEETLNSIVDKVVNKGPFSYNPDEDPLYQQMLESYKKYGESAMDDTIARASALTGGYGNSWAASAGQQAYNQYLQAAQEQLPQYYQLALNAHNMELDDLARQYSMLSEMDQKEFDRLITEIGLAQDMYNTLYSQDRQSYEDRVGNAQQLAGILNSDYWNQSNMDFSKEQFEYQKQQDAISNARSVAAAAASKADDYQDTMESALSGILEAKKEGGTALVSYLNGIKNSFSSAEWNALLAQAGITSDYENVYGKSTQKWTLIGESEAVNEAKTFKKEVLQNTKLTVNEINTRYYTFLQKYKNTPYYNIVVSLLK